MDLAAYFARIGYAGSSAATLDTLAGLLAHHVIAIPFENFDPLMRRPVSLDLAAITDKFLVRRRGGYCYEHNVLFLHVLRALGFSVTGLAAAVQWRQPDPERGPRTHMVLLVDLGPDGRWIADVGFGGAQPPAPLRLEPGVEQPTALEPYRLVPVGDEFQLQMKPYGAAWTPVYQLSLQQARADDYEVYNWFNATNPGVVFTNHLLVSRCAVRRRYTVFDNRLTVHHLDRPPVTRTLSQAEFASALLEHFDLRLPEDAGGLVERLTRPQG